MRCRMKTITLTPEEVRNNDILLAAMTSEGFVCVDCGKGKRYVLVEESQFLEAAEFMKEHCA